MNQCCCNFTLQTYFRFKSVNCNPYPLFMVEINASDSDVGAVLSQHDAFPCKKLHRLSLAERNCYGN